MHSGNIEKMKPSERRFAAESRLGNEASYKRRKDEPKQFVSASLRACDGRRIFALRWLRSQDGKAAASGNRATLFRALARVSTGRRIIAGTEFCFGQQHHHSGYRESDLPGYARRNSIG